MTTYVNSTDSKLHRNMFIVIVWKHQFSINYLNIFFFVIKVKIVTINFTDFDDFFFNIYFWTSIVLLWTKIINIICTYTQQRVRDFKMTKCVQIKTKLQNCILFEVWIFHITYMRMKMGTDWPERDVVFRIALVTEKKRKDIEFNFKMFCFCQIYFLFLIQFNLFFIANIFTMHSAHD